jgi:VWFA-related protein
MKKAAIAVCLAIFVPGFTVNFAQSRKDSTPSSSQNGKKNERPAATPTPQTSETEIERTSNETVELDGDVLKLDTEIVNIPVKVSDRQGRFIAGLTKENFKVFEDGVEQQIEYFSNEQQPFTVALLLDMSYSTKFKIAEIQNAAMSFINQLRPKDKVMIVSFDVEVHVLCEPTSDRAVLQRAIKSTKIDYGTSLYETIDFILNQKLKKITGRKAIVLFTDGVDTSSQTAQDFGNVQDVAESDVLVYPIQYDTFAEVQAMKDKPVQPSTIPTQTKNPLPFPIPTVGMMSDKGTTAEDYKKAGEYLKNMADRSGGRVYRAETGANLVDAFSKVAAELREYYSIGYSPKEESKNGKKHKVKVRVDRENLVVRAKDEFVIGKKADKNAKSEN